MRLIGAVLSVEKGVWIVAEKSNYNVVSLSKAIIVVTHAQRSASSSCYLENRRHRPIDLNELLADWSLRIFETYHVKERASYLSQRWYEWARG